MRRAFPKEKARRPAVSGLAWEDLLNNASVPELWGGICFAPWLSRSSHPRAGWGHASQTTGVRGVTGHNAPSPLAVLIIVVKRFAHEQEEEGIVHVSQRSALPGSTPHKR